MEQNTLSQALIKILVLSCTACDNRFSSLNLTSALKSICIFTLPYRWRTTETLFGSTVKRDIESSYSWIGSSLKYQALPHGGLKLFCSSLGKTMDHSFRLSKQTYSSDYSQLGRVYCYSNTVVAKRSLPRISQFSSTYQFLVRIIFPLMVRRLISTLMQLVSLPDNHPLA